MLALSLASVLAASQPADLSVALRPCESETSFEAATACMVEKLGDEGVAALRTDRDYDPSVYRAVGLTFRLQDARSPVAASMAAKGYYNADIAPAVLITMAQARTRGDGRLNDQPDLRRMIAMVNEEQVAKRKAWPPASAGRRVDLSRCPVTPARTAPGAVCVDSPEHGLSILTPLAAIPGWLAADSSSNKKAD
ncbi:hypothetical protein GCM10022280_17490 [Sphingomonas swuensis]|uniref:Uncharacterized protein n=1 Tax=Sphingomonas swuensis TaxID=977800 RepID=A0ABP7SYR3_9SPHN